MLNVGAGEIAIILVVALLLLGPRRLPELARGIGKFLREFRRQTDEVRSTLESEFYRMDHEPPKAPPPPSTTNTLPTPPGPVPHLDDGHDEHGRLLPSVTGPLDGGRRVADELGLKVPPPPSAAPVPVVTGPGPLSAPQGEELAGMPAPYDRPRAPATSGEPVPSAGPLPGSEEELARMPAPAGPREPSSALSPHVEDDANVKGGTT